MSDTNSTDQVTSDELPVWDKTTLPADSQFIVLVQEDNYDYGGMVEVAYKVPTSMILANNQIQGSVYTVTDEDAEIVVPDNTVVPAYVESFDPFHLMRAQASSQTSKAKFLIIGRNQNVDGGYLVQSSGYVVFRENHGYDIGQTYYLSDSAPGGVTTVAPSGIVQPLFTVIDAKTLQVTIGA